MAIINLAAAICGVQSKEVFFVTVENFTAGRNGYSESGYGSIDKTNPHIKGWPLTVLTTFSDHDFHIMVEEIGADQADRDIWTRVDVIGAAGSGRTRTYLYTDGDYRFVGGFDRTIWEFGDGTDPVWVDGDDTSVFPVIFYYGGGDYKP